MGPCVARYAGPRRYCADVRELYPPGGDEMDNKKIERLENEHIRILTSIIKSPDTSPAVKIQGIQTRQKIIDAMKMELNEKEEPAIKGILEVMKGEEE